MLTVRPFSLLLAGLQMHATLSGLIFARINFRGFGGFGPFPRNIIRAKYHKIFHPRNLIRTKYLKNCHPLNLILAKNREKSVKK